MEHAYNGKMQQRYHIIQGDSHFSYRQMETTVSLCHLSTKANISPLSPVSNKHVIRGLNPMATTKPSIFGTGPRSPMSNEHVIKGLSSMEG